MYHCTVLARDKEMAWVDEVHVKRWEEGLKIDLAVNLIHFKKKHQEAIDLATKIINGDTEKSDNTNKAMMGSEAKEWKRRKFGIDRGETISYEQEVGPVLSQDQSQFRYPHCPGPQRGSGFDDN